MMGFDGFRRCRMLAWVLMSGMLLTAGPSLAAGGGPPPSDDGHGAPSGGAAFVRVAPVAISLLSDGELGGKMSAAFMLEPADAQAAADIVAAERQLHDAYLRTMHRLAEAEARSGELTTIRQVKNQLKKTTDKVLGHGRVKDVLIQAFVRKSVR